MKQTRKEAETVEQTTAVARVMSSDWGEMRSIIEGDLNRAEVGMFSMLRAGVGLLCFKGMAEHGEWEARLMELCPGKSTRTLQTYMQRAREFTDAHGITPEQAWPELSKIDAAQVGSLMLAAPEALQIGAPVPEPAKRGRGKAKGAAEAAPALPCFSQILLDFIQQRKAARPKSSEPPKPLTKKEKVQTAIDEANRIVNMTADWVADGHWSLLPDDELESTMAGLRAAADKMRDEFKSRQRKI
jgi:hypothetical protein